MKSLMTITLVLILSGCYGSDITDGEPVDCTGQAECDDADPCTFDFCEAGECAHENLCTEPVCDSETHTVALPTTAIVLDVAAKNESAVIAWQESDVDDSQGYIALMPQDGDPVDALPLITTPSHGAWRPSLLWPADNPLVFWSEWDGDQGRIMMAEFTISDHSLGASRVLYSEHHASLGSVAYHPSGELGMVWSDWAEPPANVHSFFGRFSLAGEPIDIMDISQTEYSYGPQLSPADNGYSLVYTDYDEESEFSNAMNRSYSFSDGLLPALRLNVESSQFMAAALAATEEQEIVLWFHQVTEDINFLYFTWVVEGEARGTFLLDIASTGIDATSVDDTIFLSWCSRALPDTPSAVKAMKVRGWSATLVMYQELGEMGETQCVDTKVVSLNGLPTVFWLDSSSHISYRALCY